MRVEGRWWSFYGGVEVSGGVLTAAPRFRYAGCFRDPMRRDLGLELLRTAGLYGHVPPRLREVGARAAAAFPFAVFMLRLRLRCVPPLSGDFFKGKLVEKIPGSHIISIMLMQII